jgi:predicted translin family RNA/ssDNA-binding protein
VSRDLAVQLEQTQAQLREANAALNRAREEIAALRSHIAGQAPVTIKMTLQGDAQDLVEAARRGL